MCSSDLSSNSLAAIVPANVTIVAGQNSATFSVGTTLVAAPTTATITAMHMAAVYDTILRFDPTSATYQPRLATSLVASSDGRSWTLTLRAGVVLAVPNHDDLLRQYLRPRDGVTSDPNDRRNWVRYP